MSRKRNNLWHLRNKIKSNFNPNSKRNERKRSLLYIYSCNKFNKKKYTISLSWCPIMPFRLWTPLYNLYNVQRSAPEQRLRIVKFILWIFVHWSFILLAENLFILHFVFYTNDLLHFPVAISLLSGWGAPHRRYWNLCSFRSFFQSNNFSNFFVIILKSNFLQFSGNQMILLPKDIFDGMIFMGNHIFIEDSSGVLLYLSNYMILMWIQKQGKPFLF